MRPYSLCLPVLIAMVGCQSLQLEHRTVSQSSTLADIQYQEVLDNLAMFAAEPASLAWFNTMGTGKTTLQQTGQLSGGLNWDYLAGAKAGAFLNHLDKKNLGFQATQQNVGEWDSGPVLNPDKLRLMRCLYLRALGKCCDPECDDMLPRFFKDYPQHLAAIRPGWFHVGNMKDVPKLACYKGRYKTTCVWVSPDGVEGLTALTTAILDVATTLTSAYVLPPSESQILAAATKAQEERTKNMADLYKSLPDPKTNAAYLVQERFHRQLLVALAKLSTLYSPLPRDKKQAMYDQAVKAIYQETAEGLLSPRITGTISKLITSEGAGMNDAELKKRTEEAKKEFSTALLEDRAAAISSSWIDAAAPSPPPLFRPREPVPFTVPGVNVLPIP